MTTTPAGAYAVYDRPELQDAIGAPLPDGRREVLLGLDGVHCAACVGRVERLLRGRAESARVSLASRTLELVYDAARTPLSQLLALLAEAGFAPQVLAQEAALRSVARERRTALARIGVAIICAMQVMMLAWPSYFDGGEVPASIDGVLRWSQLLLAIPAVFYAGWPFLQGALDAWRARTPTMDVPVALSLLIAFGASAWRTWTGVGELYFDAATMFVMFLAIGRYLEQRTRAIAAGRLRLLAGRRALTATRLRADGAEETVPVAALVAGDAVRVTPGEALPVDGTLLDEAAELDESLLSGESRPVARRRGERVLAGSLNLGLAPLRLSATSVGAATRLAEIARLMQQAERERPVFQLLADRAAGHFILAVVVLAAIGAALWWTTDSERALNVALAVLVASCPCALSLAVPVALAAASSRLAGAGVLVARPRALTRAGKVTHVLIDKTGTLTESRLTLVQTHAFGAIDADACRRIAAALEHGLSHPIARALQDAGAASASAVAIDPAGGVSGIVDGRRYRIGPVERLAALPPAARQQLEAPAAAACTWVALGEGEALLALFALEAPVRADAAALVRALAAEGVEVELLSGDGPGPVQALQQRLQIPQARARQSPEDKLARLDALRQAGAVVMAVGDGINDAPFLAAADVALAMPGGAALAQTRADAILVGDALDGIVELRTTARLATRRMHENLAWALAYNVAVLPLALSGALTPWLASLGMSLSSLVVVANALRLPSRPAPAVPALPVAEAA